MLDHLHAVDLIEHAQLTGKSTQFAQVAVDKPNFLRLAYRSEQDGDTAR